MCIFKFITVVNMDTIALEKVSSRSYNLYFQFNQRK